MLWRFWRLACVLPSLVVLAGVADAQPPRPQSDVGGFTGRELGRIYARDIGRGHTAQSLNQIALQSARGTVPNVGQTVRPTTSTIEGGVSTGPVTSPPAGGKPFAGFAPEPTVSPYMNLFREDLDIGGDLNYQTLVRPQLQQQQFNTSMQRQNLELNRRMQAMAAQPAFHPRGDQQQMPTGHATAFMFFGRYYPALNPRGRR